MHVDLIVIWVHSKSHVFKKLKTNKQKFRMEGYENVHLGFFFLYL
jgi:hypothetical protein